ncbi:LysR family transcriptional regulator [Pseudomonas tolaasii]|uniref:LysR family transcriptional regulator n=1 Tax=Pseudomonas tolaasii TaxID=29442 RepID=UPI0015A15E12|nr:LysR family transcriptional regulator [Pseudomonas tolaasii]MBW1246785.1 LysR family transcriptional regulator [Pseudomonas tolaasii]NVZ44632.1 LysR family transcriptional regulator [Pseudomonas tolaasii]NWA47493.1 LysR family transcriptional regulator [Pseudomonas tolaasii]
MIRELRTFVSAARRGTFAAAGQQVGLTQSAVSAQIKHLEDALGVKLFDRTGRSATLNAAGQRAVPLAEEILDIFSRMGAPDSANNFHGSLRIGAIGSVQTGILPQALVALKRRAPFIEVSLVPGVSLNLLSQVDAGELDLAIMIHPPFNLPKDLNTEVIAREPFVLITAKDVEGDDPLQILREQPFVRYDRGSFGGRQVTQFLKEHKIQTQQALELDELDAIVKMVRSGLGVSLVPLAGLWLEHDPEVRVLRLDTLTFHREIVLLTKYTQRQLPLFALFRSCVMEVLAAPK